MGDDHGVLLETSPTDRPPVARLATWPAAVLVGTAVGALTSPAQTLLGDTVLRGAAALQADVALVGAHAVTGTVLSETDPDVAAVKRAFFGAARSRRLLVDSSKFRPRAFMQFGDATEVAQIVTDSGLAEALAEPLRQAGIVVDRVHVG